MRPIALGLIVASLVLAGGCPPENYSSLSGPTLQEIDAIRNNDQLTAQEQRLQLEALGLSDVTINGLLASEELGNQFGGDLRSAYDKVVLPDFTLLTPDELQIYANEASAVDDTLAVSLSDVEAQDLVDFLSTYDINSAEELQAYLDAGGIIPGDTLPELVPQLLIDFNPDLLIPVLP